MLNCGSSSIKCSFFDWKELAQDFSPPFWEKKVEWKNIQQEGLGVSFQKLLSHFQVDGIAHRIVHGGRKYRKTIQIDAEVKKEIRNLAHLAPLHNLEDLKAIETLEKIFPHSPQIAVFDTAFHRTLPEKALIYPGPYQWYKEGIERYGFHGISYQYCTRRAATLLGHMPKKMIICHLGSGASLCAVQEGKSIDTTMGFTPLEGLMMDTRSGTIDPGILLHLLKKKTREELSEELYQKSGLLGLSGVSSDMRDVLEQASQSHERAQLAVDVYVHRLVSAIGSMAASLSGLDTLVFTGGIGENASFIRKKVCERLSFLGVHLSDSEEGKEDRDLSLSESRVKVLLIHTQEAFEMARECWIWKSTQSG